MMFQDAIEVMVDEVEERGERVLALLDEAKLSKQTAALRREIARAVEVARKRTSAEAKRVAASGAQDLASLSLRELRELAYNLGESNSREDQARAARLEDLVSVRGGLGVVEDGGVDDDQQPGSTSPHAASAGQHTHLDGARPLTLRDYTRLRLLR